MGDVIRFLRWVSRLFKRNGGPLAGLMVLGLLLSLATPHFFTASNLRNVAQQASINAIVSIGMTFVIITAGIDLSVGSVLALVGVVLASLLHAGWSLPPAVGSRWRGASAAEP